METRQKIKAKKRDVFGKSVKKMRKEGVLPGVVYGRDFESVSVQFLLKEFQEVYKEVGETSLLHIEIEEHGTYPVLIKQVQLHPLSDLPLHIDFYKVDLTKKVSTKVPLEFVGETIAVKEGGIFIEILTEVEVEALPQDLPSSFSVDISQLMKINDFMTVSALKIPQGVDLKTSKEEIICKVEEPREEEEVKEVSVEDVQVTTEKKEEEGEVSETGKAEGKTEKKLEKKEEKSK